MIEGLPPPNPRSVFFAGVAYGFLVGCSSAGAALGRAEPVLAGVLVALFLGALGLWADR